MRAVILAGGPVVASDRLRSRVRGAPLVIAADGGLRHAAALDLHPQTIVGDFDSVGDDELAAWPDVARERHPTDKDHLDLELALDVARDRGATRTLVVGALGGRVDQSLAAVLIALRRGRDGEPIVLDSGDQEVRVLAAGQRTHLAAPVGTRFSLVTLPGGAAPATVSLTGAAYDLERSPLPWGVGRGLSNAVAASDGANVDVHEGDVVVWIAWAPDPAGTGTSHGDA